MNMREDYIGKFENARNTVTLSFEAISGTDVIRFRKCNGREHWFEEETTNEAATGRFDIVVDNVTGKAPCDCPDKDNRKDAFDIFK